MPHASTLLLAESLQTSTVHAAAGHSPHVAAFEDHTIVNWIKHNSSRCHNSRGEAEKAVRTGRWQPDMVKPCLRETCAALLDDGVLPSAFLWDGGGLLGGVAAS